MNVFYLDRDPVTAAKMHCDKHVVKMIIEYAQLMSTAHRVLDGEMYYGLTKNGRKIKRWKLNSNMEDILYKASHINHPSAIWARQSNNNYNWLYCLFTALCDEYTHRYGKVHERVLFDDLERKRDIAEFLQLTDEGEGVRIFIGSENKLFSLSGSSLVVSPYMNADQKVVGAIGVIGPTRLNYGRIVPIVNYTAQMVGRVLSDRG